MSWADGQFLAFDTETTGVNTDTDRIVTACVVRCGGGQDTQPVHWLVNPGVPIPKAASDVHGITDEHVAVNGLAPAVAVEQITVRLMSGLADGLPLVGMNLGYDLTILDRECRRHLQRPLPFTPRPCVDPSVIDRALDKYRKGKRTLTDLCAHYRVNLDGAHDASFDAIAAARLVWRLARVYPQLADASLEELHDRQVEWRRDWADGFRAYLQKQGKAADDVDGSWPLRPLVGEAAA